MLKDKFSCTLVRYCKFLLERQRLDNKPYSLKLSKNYIHELSKWVRINRLALNKSKGKFMLFYL